MFKVEDLNDAYNPAYSEWLEGYVHGLAAMDPVDRAKELRLDVQEEDEDGIYADYLDYVEEWTWAAKLQQQELTSIYVRHLAYTEKQFPCDCGETHVLTTKSSSKPKITYDDPRVLIHEQCWYQTVVKAVKGILERLKGNQASFRLPVPIEELLTKIVKWRLNQNGQTVDLLPYDQFMEVWHKKTATGQDSERAKKMIQQLDVADQLVISQTRNRCETKIPEKAKKILFHYPHEEHGLHVLCNVIGEQKAREMVKWMVKERRKIYPQYVDLLSWNSIKESMTTCQECTEKNYPVATALTIFGIYYGPPGVGKTTSMNRSLFVGFDTDWIGIGIGWQSYSYLIKEKIPIITNQKYTFIGSGLKLIGVFKSDIRKIDKQPLDRVEAIERLMETSPKEVTLFQISNKEYFSDYLLRMELVQMLHKLIVNQAVNLRPFYRNEQDPEWLRRFPTLLRRKEKQT